MLFIVRTAYIWCTRRSHYKWWYELFVFMGTLCMLILFIESKWKGKTKKNRHSPTLLKRSELIHSHIMLIVMDNIYISESKKRKIMIRLPDDAVISSKRPTRSNTTVPGFRVTLCPTGNILDDDVYRTVIMNYKLHSCCSLLAAKYIWCTWWSHYKWWYELFVFTGTLCMLILFIESKWKGKTKGNLRKETLCMNILLNINVNIFRNLLHNNY